MAFARLVAARLGPALAVFSYLRPRSELWVAQQFAGLTDFHQVFQSCNRAFHQDPAQRLDHWCGRCDKCCFVDLILAPFMSAEALGAVFEAGEPSCSRRTNLSLREAALGLQPDAKPFECVGDVDERRAALALAVARDDRRTTTLLHTLQRRLPAALPLATLLAPKRAPARFQTAMSLTICWSELADASVGVWGLGSKVPPASASCSRFARRHARPGRRHAGRAFPRRPRRVGHRQRRSRRAAQP